MKLTLAKLAVALGPQRAVSSKENQVIRPTHSAAARLRPIVLTVAAFIGAASVALGHPVSASAHYTDRLHQHGWAWGGPDPKCYREGNLGYVVINRPNFATTPVRPASLGGNGVYEEVWHSVKLEWAHTTSNTWYVASSSYIPHDWYWTRANNQGLVLSGWVNYYTKQWAKGTIYTEYVPADLKYRIRLTYSWYDGVRHDDVTAACTV